MSDLPSQCLSTESPGTSFWTDLNSEKLSPHIEEFTNHGIKLRMPRCEIWGQEIHTIIGTCWGGEGHKETLLVPTLWILVDSGKEEKFALGPFVVTKTVNHKKDP